MWVGGSGVGCNDVHKWYCHVYVGLVEENYVLRRPFVLYNVDDGLEFLGVCVIATVVGIVGVSGQEYEMN